MARGRTLCRALAVLRDVPYANPTGRKLRFKSPRGRCPDQVVAELYNVREYGSSPQDLHGRRLCRTFGPSHMGVILSASEGPLVHRAAGPETQKAFGMEREALRSTSG